MARPRRFVRLDVSRLESRDTPSIASVVGTTNGVIAYDANHNELFRTTPFGAGFTGGVRTALADVNGDGELDLVAAAGRGSTPTVVVYDGATYQEANRFDAYESTFSGGVNLGAADLNGDGLAEIVVGADLGGGPRVRVLDGATVLDETPVAIADFIAIADANFRGGVRLAVGDLTKDGIADLVVGAGEGGGPRVAGYEGKALGEGTRKKFFVDFFSYDPGLRDGTKLSIYDVNSDGINDLVFDQPPAGISRRFIGGQNGAFITDGIYYNDHDLPAYEYAVGMSGRIQHGGQVFEEMIPVLIGGPGADDFDPSSNFPPIIPASPTTPTGLPTWPGTPPIIVVNNGIVPDGLIAAPNPVP